MSHNIMWEEVRDAMDWQDYDACLSTAADLCHPAIQRLLARKLVLAMGDDAMERMMFKLFEFGQTDEYRRAAILEALVGPAKEVR